MGSKCYPFHGICWLPHPSVNKLYTSVTNHWSEGFSEVLLPSLTEKPAPLHRDNTQQLPIKQHKPKGPTLWHPNKKCHLWKKICQPSHPLLPAPLPNSLQKPDMGRSKHIPAQCSEKHPRAGGSTRHWSWPPHSPLLLSRPRVCARAPGRKQPYGKRRDREVDARTEKFVPPPLLHQHNVQPLCREKTSHATQHTATQGLSPTCKQDLTEKKPSLEVRLNPSGSDHLILRLMAMSHFKGALPAHSTGVVALL